MSSPGQPVFKYVARQAHCFFFKGTRGLVPKITRVCFPVDINNVGQKLSMMLQNAIVLSRTQFFNGTFS